MSEIKFEQPTISGQAGAPISIENKSFPYNELADHRRYEELVYSIFSEKIRHKLIASYDSISLMSGVRDKGRDCSLYTSTKFTALIQCKKYKNPLSKDQFGKEIVKFLLYSLIYDELHFEITHFTYIIAASGGFSNDCSDFIESAGNHIDKKEEIDNWIKYCFQEKKFHDIPLKEARSYVFVALKKINIQKISPQDLDKLLIKDPCKELIPLFFQIRSIVDTEEVRKVNDRLDKFMKESHQEIPIKQQLSWGSHSLKLEKNEFDEIPDSHIPRKETEELIQWIQKPVAIDKEGKFLNICILAGDAGMGKTVILKDLYNRLEQESIPVLGLKADKLYVDSDDDLQKRLGLSLSVIKFLDRCMLEFDQVVLIIDQLDALSQSMSSERKYLMLFKSLIDYFTYKPNIRIVLSIRLRDLHYDPTLKSYRHIKSIPVALLTQQQVLTQLDKIHISKNELSDKLIELLKVPQHLNIFSRIAVTKRNFSGLHSLHDLYSQLWQQQIVEKPERLGLKPQRIRKLLYKIATFFFKHQRTEVHRNHFENFSRELSYLESEHLIRTENLQLQLFHQTFYDFIFSKNFVEDQNDLLVYVISQKQSLLIRSAIKMIVNYLREFDPVAYHHSLEKLLSDNQIYFHVKHLLISHLAFQQEPTIEEIDLVLNYTKYSIPLQILFLELAQSPKWLQVILTEDRLQMLNTPIEENKERGNNVAVVNQRFLKKTALGYLSNFVNLRNSDAWKFVLEKTTPETKKEILFRLHDWTNPKSYELFDLCQPMHLDNYGYLSTLAKIAKEIPETAWENIKITFLSDTYLNQANPHDHILIDTLKSLTERIPETLIPELTNKMIVDLTSPPKDDDDDFLFALNPYEFVNLELQEDLNGKSFIFQLLAECLRVAYNKDLPIFEKFLNDHSNSKHFPMLQLVMSSIQDKEPQYADTVFYLLQLFNERENLDYHGDPGTTFRNLLEKAFPFFSKQQQQQTLEIIKKIQVPYEAFVIKRQEKSHLNLSWGKSKLALLKRIPEEAIHPQTALYKEYQELQRKFPNLEEDYGNSGLAGIVKRPLTAEAYEHMSEKQWLRSFKKYDKERDPFQKDFLKGGLHEHSWAFREIVKNDPSEQKIKIIQKSIGQPRVDSSYPILGLSGFCDAKGDPEIVLGLFKSILATKDYDSQLLPCISIAAYVIQEERADQEIYDFLFSTCKNTSFKPYEKFREDHEKTSIRGLITAGINSIHGSIAQAVAYSRNEEMATQVYDFMDLVFSNHNESTKAALLFQYAQLMHLNKKKTFNLFVKHIADEEDVFLLASSLNALRYLCSYNFDACLPIFKKLVKSPKIGSEDTNLLFGMLFRQALQKHEEAKKLLFEFVGNQPEARRTTFFQVIKHYNYNENTKGLCNNILRHALKNIKPDEFVHRRRHFFNMDHISLQDIYPFLEEYVISSEFIPSDKFVSYLLQESHAEPGMAIALFQLSMKQNCEVLQQEYIMFQNNSLGTKFIVGAFHALNQSNPQMNKLRQQLLELLDEVLQDMRYWQENSTILKELS